MIKQANNLSFFMGSSFGGERETTAASAIHIVRNSAYQQLVYKAFARAAYTSEGLKELAKQLTSIICRAHAARQIDTVEQLCELMLGLPVSEEMKAVARYYQGATLHRRREFDRAEQVLSCAVEEVPIQYKGRALHSLGATYHDRGEIDSAVPLFVEALKAAKGFDPLTTVESHWFLAINRSIHGNHRRALADLESLFPLIHSVAGQSGAFFDYLNSYAVELGEVGQIDGANAALNIALASPFSSAYPYWNETRDELETKRRHPRPSFVALSSRTMKSSEPQLHVEPMPQPIKRQRPKVKRRRASVIVRALHWLAGLSIFSSVSYASILAKSICAALDAPSPKTSDWPTSGPSPRAPPPVR